MTTNIPQALADIYSKHNKYKRGEYFITMERERGPFLRDVIGKGKKVLDIGCRDGALTKYFAEGNEIMGLDIDAEALERAKKIITIETRQVDLNGDWGVSEKAYDAVVAAEVLEHVYYPHKITEKVANVLKDDGVFIGSIPHAFCMQSRIRILFGTKRHTPLQDPTHINHFTYKEFRSILEDNFQEIKIIPLVSKKFKLLSYFAPYLFAPMLLFTARTPRRK